MKKTKQQDEWEKLFIKGNIAIKERKLVFGDTEWLKSIPEFQKMKRKKMTMSNLNRLKVLVNKLKS